MSFVIDACPATLSLNDSNHERTGAYVILVKLEPSLCLYVSGIWVTPSTTKSTACAVKTNGVRAIS